MPNAILSPIIIGVLLEIVVATGAVVIGATIGGLLIGLSIRSAGGIYFAGGFLTLDFGGRLVVVDFGTVVVVVVVFGSVVVVEGATEVVLDAGGKTVLIGTGGVITVVLEDCNVLITV